MRDLGLTDISRSEPTGGCGAGCACGHGHGAGHGHASASPAPQQRFAVEGMTCAHCVASVTEEVGALGGVEHVDVDLVANGVSTVAVSASRPLGTDEVRAAIEDAGYRLARQ